MRSLNSVLSRLSWLFFNLGCYGTHYVVFRPSLVEFLVFCVVEGVAFFLMVQADKKFFPYLYPDTRSFFPNFNTRNFTDIPAAERESLIKSLMRFPYVRAGYCWIMSYAKVLPSNALIVTFYWKHESSNLLQFGIFIAIETLWYAYLYGVQYIELHQMVSEKIAQIHKRLNLSHTFNQMSFRKLRRSFETPEAIAFCSIWISFFLLQGLLLIQSPGGHDAQVGWILGAATIVAFVLMARLWWLNKMFVSGGLAKLLSGIEAFDPRQPYQAVSLSSSYEIARFQKMFNLLMEKLQSYASELSQWVTARSEQSRYQALGELSSLVVHDISGPLHVIDFCTSQLREDPDKMKDQRYIDQLSSNSVRALELVRSLRIHLGDRPIAYSNQGSQLVDAYTHVLRLLRVQFGSEFISRINIHMEEKLSHVSAKMSLTELVHVLFNVLQNACENLLDNEIENPQIDIRLDLLDKGGVYMMIEDNGTGLSSDAFEDLTALLPRNGQKTSHNRRGLGLRLIRRLLERSEGDMTIVDPPPRNSGTCLRMYIPTMQGAEA